MIVFSRILLLLVSPLLSVSIGMLGGLIVETVFSETTARVLGALNLNLELNEVGGALGFMQMWFCKNTWIYEFIDPSNDLD